MSQRWKIVSGTILKPLSTNLDKFFVETWNNANLFSVCNNAPQSGEE